MTGRVDPFAMLKEPLPAFTTKPRKDRPVEEEAIARIAEHNNFPSRQAAKPAKLDRRKPRVYRTGRNQQFNAKVTPETIQRFYKAADEKRVPLGELLKQSLDALDTIAVLQTFAAKEEKSVPELLHQIIEALERERGSILP